MKLTAQDVYYQLTQYMYISCGSVRKSNIFAVKHTWFYFNNQDKLTQLMLHGAKLFCSTRN